MSFESDSQLAKTRRALFVEGKDFQILGRLARKLGYSVVGNRSEFAVVPVEGFNPERIRSLKAGMEMTLGGEILAAAILDKDYRSDRERAAIVAECSSFCSYVAVLERKEIENFLLVPSAIDRAAARKVVDQVRRTGVSQQYATSLTDLLTDFAEQRKDYVMAQYLAERRRFERQNSRSVADATINEAALKEFHGSWRNLISRLKAIPGKDAISAVNQYLQKTYGVSVTPTAIIDAMNRDEVPGEAEHIIKALSDFCATKAG